ncbi:DegT/DnrJ/EryC1/StrS family aminotransferase [Bacillus cereus]
MNKIEFGELRIGFSARKHLEDVCNSNWASSGPKVKQFESEWGKLFGYDHNFAVSSGTDACLNMCLAVRAYLEDEDKWLGEGVHTILVPALSFIATSNAVRAAGFKPKWVDIRKDTLNINESKIENSINSLTVAIMPVHTMGRPCEMDDP